MWGVWPMLLLMLDEFALESASTCVRSSKDASVNPQRCSYDCAGDHGPTSG